jgi:hypothetical protein
VTGGRAIVSADTVTWAADQVIRQHSEPPAGRPDGTPACAQCPPDGPCPLLAWADVILGQADESAGWHVERDDPEAAPGPMPPHYGWPLGGRGRSDASRREPL